MTQLKFRRLVNGYYVAEGARNLYTIDRRIDRSGNHMWWVRIQRAGFETSSVAMRLSVCKDIANHYEKNWG